MALDFKGHFLYYEDMRDRLNKVNTARKLSRKLIKLSMLVYYFGKPKSWSNYFYERKLYAKRRTPLV